VNIANNYSKEKVTGIYVELVSGLIDKKSPDKTAILSGHNHL
jgi:hypothetical protein